MSLHKKVLSMVSLLDDTSAQIRQLVREQLVELGEPVLPYLAESYIDVEDVDIKEQIRELTQEIILHRFENRIALLGDREDNIALERFSFKIAQLEYPGLSIREYEQQLDQMALEIRTQTTANSSKLELVQSLNWYLFKKFGLQANRFR